MIIRHIPSNRNKHFNVTTIELQHPYLSQMSVNHLKALKLSTLSNYLRELSYLHNVLSVEWEIKFDLIEKAYQKRSKQIDSAQWHNGVTRNLKAHFWPLFEYITKSILAYLFNSPPSSSSSLFFWCNNLLGIFCNPFKKNHR